MSDEHFMRQALQLASRGVGVTGTNPTVGCLLVKDGVIVGRGWTGQGGRPHAEAGAIRAAGEQAGAATAYVTLEPCAHSDTTPSCAESLIAAGVTRAVVALRDPDPRTAGNGIAKLREAGIEVAEGLLEAEAALLNAGFLRRITHGMPWVSMKLATSADGYMANAAGQSQWITGPKARAEGHAIRARHDAVVSGIGTVLADDPALTVRLAGREDASPIRIVLDRKLRLPVMSRLAQTAKEVPVWAITTAEASEEREAALTRQGVEVHRLDDPELAPEGVLKLLAAAGVNRALIEGGPRVQSRFLPHADRVHWFRAPFVIGSRGLAPFDPQNAPLSELPRWKLIRSQLLGPDRLETYACGN